MRYISLFSGIEAATSAWHPLGWTPLAFSEIEAFPRAVLKHHYPKVPNLGDITKFKEWPDFGTVDLVVGGAPCQAFSVAGLRAGLADPRGNLTLTYLAVIDRYKPKWILFENVPGILSINSHDAPDQSPPPNPVDMELDGQEVVVDDEYVTTESHAFAALLAGLQELGYGFAYRVLDAQYTRASGFPVAVPQRRRRVFVVGYLGDWRRAAAVLFDAASLRGDPPPRREAGQGTSTDVVSSLTASGRGVERTGESRGQDPVIAVASTGDVAHCLNAGGMGRQDYETETMVAHALRADGFDASEDGTGRGTPLLPVAFDARQADVLVYDDITGPMDTGFPGPSFASGWAVRRLTPLECERLQGFPDDFTAIPYRGKPAADGPRYKSLGNSMAVNVMRAIGERITMVDALTRDD